MLKNIPSNIQFPSDLPVSQRANDIKLAIKKNQVTIICGETGSGKTTQLPKICLALGRGQKKIIGHTQPRRIAARSVATRISEELKTRVGGLVGFKVRFTDKTSKQSSIKVMTDGILLAETQNDILLEQYDTIIIDEAHERSLNIDFLLGYLKNLLPKRPDLKLIITSATIDVDKFSSHFNDAPIIKVSGRTYPVETVYRPLIITNDEIKESIDEAILSSIQFVSQEKGDILIFLPGERDIHDIKRFLVDQLKDNFDVLPLFSRLPVKEQQKIFQTSSVRRIILSTNIAETSLTVPGIKFVIDTGLARIIRYSPRLKIEQLHIEKISKASANQRAGRCGRIAPGVCIRLYEEDDFENRSDFTDPEIMRTSLASVILKMASLKLGPVGEFPFLQPPIQKFIQDGYQLLYELNAVDKDFKILPLGTRLSKLPLDPSLGRILLEAKKQNCLKEILVVISALSISDPKERPFDKAEKADQAHLLFHDSESGFLSFLKLWKLLKSEKQSQNSKTLRNFCQKYFLSFTRMREWQELHKQLSEMIKEFGFNISEKNATYEQIHVSLLSGLLGNIGFKIIDEYYYQGTRSIKFLIGPKLFRNKNYKWIMAAEILDTGKLYAQCIAKIDISWVEKLASHLVDYEYSNPRWDKKLARVNATQKTLLYGLIINPSKTIHYGSININESRQIFIRQGLVEMDYETNADFWQHNLMLIDEVQKLEHKSRRQDILINKDVLYEFYDNKIGKELVNGSGFEFWRKGIEKKDPKFLFLNKEFLMQKSANRIDEIQYPDFINLNNSQINFNYRFEPNHPNDGLTVSFSYSILSQIKPESFDWLVPGMIREKVTTIIKNLPKSIRSQLVPASQIVTEFLSESNIENRFNESLTEFIRKKTNSNFRIDKKQIELLPEHLKVNYLITDEDGLEIDSSKSLTLLQKKNKERVVEVIEEVRFEIESKNLIYWPNFDIPNSVESIWNEEKIIGFPALIDRGNTVDLKVLDDPNESEKLHLIGVKALLKFQNKDRIKFFKKNSPQFNNPSLLLKTFIEPDHLQQNLIDVIINESMNWDKPVPRTKKSFDELVVFSKGRIGKSIIELLEILTDVAKVYQQISLFLDKNKLLPKFLLDDVEEQLEILLPPYEPPLFIFKNLIHYPRYLLALKVRIEKFNQRKIIDQDLSIEINRMQQKWIEKVAEYVDDDLDVPKGFIEFQWQLQELRVSLFAQELKTPYPVSIKRLDKNWITLIN